MRSIQLNDLWHLEKAITVVAMMAAVVAILALFAAINERFGFAAGGVFALTALAACVWIILRFVPLSEYLGRKS
jgi:hypothetical protein